MSEYQKTTQHINEFGRPRSKENLENLPALQAIEKKAEALLDKSEYTKSTHLGTNDFFVGKNNFCEEIKKEKIFPPLFRLHNFNLSLVESRPKTDDYWQLRMNWTAGNMPYDVRISPDETVIDSAYNKELRRFDLALAPKLIAGFVSASADTNNYEIWNQDYLKKAESLTQVNSDEALELIDELICGLADVSGNYNSTTTTPVLIDSLGRGLKIQRNVEKSPTDCISYITKIKLAQENPLGVLTYYIEQTRHIDLNDYETKQNKISRQTTEGNISSQEIDADISDLLYGYKPTVLDPVSDSDSYNKILQSVESSLSEFS